MIVSMFNLLAAEGSSGGIPWWVCVILIIILLVLLWFWFGREEEVEIGETRLGDATDEIAEVVSPTEMDDLKKIEGIGPKVAGLLNEAGISTFQDLFDAGVEKLEAILDEAGLQMINADTWPEQAKLVAAGEWEALTKLQDELKGGKRAV